MRVSQSTSWNASSRFRLICGRATMTISAAAAISSPSDSGRVTNTVGSPRDSSMARRRFSSIIGPRMKPRISGAGSQRSLKKR